jgi:exosortase
MLLSRKIQWLTLTGLLVILYGDVLIKWGADLWNDDNYSHGLFIPFISVYFVKLRLGSLKKASVSPCYSGLLVILAGLALFILGTIGGEIFSKRFSLIILIYGLILFMEGKETTSLLRFPVGILFFAVPLPYILYNAVAFPLKLVATQISVILLGLYGLPVFREGNIIYLSHTTLEVVDACSGIRSLMTLITLAFFLACLMHRKFLIRFLIMALAIPIAVLANAIRVALNGILTQYNPAWSEGFWHDFSGWMVFVLSFIILWTISLLIRKFSPNTQ